MDTRRKTWKNCYTGAPVDPGTVREHMERLNRLKRVTDERTYHLNIDRVAFCQEDLARLVLEEGETSVYLCREEGEDFVFTIPSSRGDVAYYGIPCKGEPPQVRVTRGAWDRLEELGIEFHACDLIRPEPNQAGPEQADLDELESSCEEPVHQLFQQLLQKKARGPEAELTVAVTIFGPEQVPADPKWIRGTAKELKEDIALFIQEAIVRNDGESQMISGAMIAADDLSCCLKIRPDFCVRARVQGVHIERDAAGRRSVYADLLNPVRLNGKKYRAVPIYSAEIYQMLNLLEGSELDLFCLGDLPPVSRVYERGCGRTLRCPYCGSRFLVREDRVFCENPVCTDRLHGRIYRFSRAWDFPMTRCIYRRWLRSSL